jgi:hypothetical protein
LDDMDKTVNRDLLLARRKVDEWSTTATSAAPA